MRSQVIIHGFSRTQLSIGGVFSWCCNCLDSCNQWLPISLRRCRSSRIISQAVQLLSLLCHHALLQKAFVWNETLIVLTVESYLQWSSAWSLSSSLEVSMSLFLEQQQLNQQKIKERCHARITPIDSSPSYYLGNFEWQMLNLLHTAYYN